MSRLRFAWIWLQHAHKLHYTRDLGPIVEIHSHWWGDVLIRECSLCRRRFVDLGSGLPEMERG